VLFRTVLRLSGEDVPRSDEEVLRLAGERVGFEPGAMLEVLRARRAGEALRVEADDPRVSAYLDAVALTVGHVDRM